MVEAFYHQQIDAAHKRLYELVQQLIQLVLYMHLMVLHIQLTLSQGLLEAYIPEEYPTIDKSHRVPFLGGSLDAVLESDDETDKSTLIQQ